MLWINPNNVTLGNDTLTHVGSISVDRFASRFSEEWSDLGPYQVFADMAQERVTCRIIRDISLDDAARITALATGAQLTLSFQTAPGTSDAARQEVTMSIVIRSVEHDTHPTRGMKQVITGVAISPDGATDPVVETQVVP